MSKEMQVTENERMPTALITNYVVDLDLHRAQHEEIPQLLPMVQMLRESGVIRPESSRARYFSPCTSDDGATRIVRHVHISN